MTGRVLWRGALALAVAVSAAVGTWALWHGRPADAPAEQPPRSTPGVPWLIDVTAASGVDFRHFDSSTPLHYLPETMGSGTAWIDYDADGWPDLFLVQVRALPRGGPAEPPSRLYRNNRDGTFADVTAAAGPTHVGYGMGAAVGDYDNDGFDDLAVTYLDRVVLYHNEPDGRGGRRFADVSPRAGLHNPHWGTSCGWGDVDGDGLLDLYVCNYVAIDLARYQPCVNTTVNENFICPPNTFPHVPHALFRNRGDGTFEDISTRSGVGDAPPGPGLGVVLVDLDDDGQLDIYAANDMKPAYLFRNRGGGRFDEVAWNSGAACMMGGRFMAGMGVEAGDVDGTGRPSLFVTNFQAEPNMLFLNRGKLRFQDWSFPSGLGPPSLARLGFGAVLCDLDLDGALDAAVANGHVVRNAEAIYHAPFRQEAQLFLGLGGAKFRDASTQAGPYFREKHVGRGLAAADYDNDGRPDLVVTHNGDRPALLHNETPTEHHWLRLDLEGDGKKSNRNAIGARVEVEAGGRTLTRFVVGGGSYLSASDRRVLLGLGPAVRADRVTVRWPSGQVQQIGPLAADAGYHVREGHPRSPAAEKLPAARTIGTRAGPRARELQPILTGGPRSPGKKGRHR